MKDLDLRGKDYLTQKEAAHYCGCSLNTFREWVMASGISVAKPMGKLLYRRADIQRELEKAWQPYKLDKQKRA